jgi:Sec-independent protein translocase protein TatA
MVPIAIVLVGALIIFGITKMLSTERSYKDLVQEMQSKTFGNRWIAAYELSKQIISEQIPEEEKPWLVENLADIYKNTPDPRTKFYCGGAWNFAKSFKSSSFDAGSE